MYAIIKTGGKQYKVSEGDTIYIEKLKQEEGKEVIFDEILLISSDSELSVGQPFLPNAKVSATVIKHGKSKKVLMMKYRPKKDLHKKRGHRQEYTSVKIDKITA